MPDLRSSRAATFWTAAALLVLVLAASAAPSPLYRVYQDRFGFSSGVLTAVFGIYAFALLGALLVVGRLSDHVGRRPVLVAGLLLQVAASLLFLSADGVGWLLTARVVQGLSVGALTGTLGAILLDSQHSDRPRAALLNSASPGVGLALGAVAAGLAIEGVAAPTAWVFGVMAVLFSLAVLVVVPLLPETSPRVPGALASLRPRVHVPAAQRAAFVVAAPCLVALWALGGLYLSLGPSLAAGVFGIEDHLVGSLLLVAVNGTGAVASVALWRADPSTAMLLGCLVFATGVGGTVVSLTTGNTAVFFTAAAVSGFGFGAAFVGAIATVTRGVAPGERGGLLSSVFVVGYLAFSIPAMAAGLAASQVGLRPTGQVYGAAVVVLAVAAAVGLLRVRRRATERRPQPQKDPLAPHHSHARGGSLQGGRAQL